MDNRQLEYIIAIAEEKNLTKAAERLYITQSALSQQLAKLKAEGLPPLFEKHGREMHLTDAGRIYVYGARTILRIDQEARTAMRNLSSGRKGVIHIAISPPLLPAFIRKAIPQIRNRLPDTDMRLLSLSSGQALGMIDRGDADLAIFPTITQHRELFSYTNLSEDELVIAKKPELKSTVLPLTVPERDSHLYNICARTLSDNKLHPEIFAETNDLAAAEEAALSGVCGAVLPKSYAEGKALAVIPFREPGIYKIVAARRRKSDMRSTEDEIIGILRNVF